jgi:hypothetical protein
LLLLGLFLYKVARDEYLVRLLFGRCISVTNTDYALAYWSDIPCPNNTNRLLLRLQLLLLVKHLTLQNNRIVVLDIDIRGYRLLFVSDGRLCHI